MTTATKFGPRLRDVRAEQRSLDLHGAVSNFTLAAMFYGQHKPLALPEIDARRALLLARTQLNGEVRKYFFRTVLAAISKDADETDYAFMKAAREADVQVYGSRIA